MTTIIGFVDKKEKCAYLGSDSQVSYSNIKYTNTTCKILNLHNKLLIGLSGATKNFNILESSNIISDLIKDNKITKNLIIREFIPKLYSELEEYKGIKYDDYQRYNITLILAYEDKIIAIDSSGCVIEHNDYWAEGSGFQIALGALYINENVKEMTALDKVLYGLKAASKFDRSTNRPFVIYSTKDFKKIQK